MDTVVWPSNATIGGNVVYFPLWNKDIVVSCKQVSGSTGSPETVGITGTGLYDSTAYAGTITCPSAVGGTCSNAYDYVVRVSELCRVTAKRCGNNCFNNGECIGGKCYCWPSAPTGKTYVTTGGGTNCAF